jgi:cellulose synthase/poly-beta-1,6-N-acetylglucosamine synthase-like glycosyltransferase
VSICKEAILGNCSKNECKFIIYAPKNFNGKFFISIIIKVGVRTLPALFQQQQRAHISHFFSSFLFLFTIPSHNKYVRLFFFFFYIHTFVFLHYTYLHKTTCIFFSLLLFLMFMISIFLLFVCVFVCPLFPVCDEKFYSTCT